MPRINLLPWRDQQRQERKMAFYVGLAGALGAALIATFAGFLVFNSLISSQDQRNQRLRGEIKILDSQIQEINDLETQKDRFIGRMQVIEKLQQSRSDVVHLFDEVTNLVPDGVFLTSFKQTNRKLRFDGVTQSSTRVSSFLQSIDTSQWLRNGDLVSIESKQGQSNGDSFVLNAEQVATATEDDEAAASKQQRTRRISGVTR
jgi:type IV pilus assembly protein PilN